MAILSLIRRRSIIRAPYTHRSTEHNHEHTPVSIPVALDPDGLYYRLSAKLSNNGLPLLIVIDRHNHIRYSENGFDTADKTRLGLATQIDTLLAAR